MVGLVKPTVHIDEFASKMGDDEDIIVVSFYVRNQQAADDLVAWFEKGYDWVLDADQSPGEIRPGRWLVYLEMRRRSTSGNKVAELIGDLETLTELGRDQWVMTYKNKDYAFDKQTFDQVVPLTPAKYRELSQRDLNEVRIVAGIEPTQIYQRESDIKKLQAAAGI